MRYSILAAIAALGFSACNGTTAPNIGDYEPLPSDQVLIGVEHAMTSNGVRQSILRSDTTLLFNDSASVHLRGVNLTMYTPEGQIRATLTSQSGEMDQNTNRMVARGSVVLVIHGQEGSTVWSEELHYDPQRGQLWSEVHTRRRTTGGQEVEGDGFTSDDQFRNFRITNMRGTNLRFEF